MNNKAMISVACAALAWTVGNVADAAPVTTEDAAYAVEAWVVRGGTLGARLGGVVRVDAHEPANGAKFYAVKTSGGGTVFTSADTEDEPILAFTSAKDDFSKIDERSPLWALLARERSAARPALMTAAKSAANGQSAAAAKWSKLIAEGKARAAAAANGVVFPAKSGLPSVGDVRVAPLLQTKWYQLGDGAGGFHGVRPHGKEMLITDCCARELGMAVVMSSPGRKLGMPFVMLLSVQAGWSTDVGRSGFYDILHNVVGGWRGGMMV